jgi:site-specific recombinase XerD
VWRRSLRARNPAPKTLMTYTASADQFVAWLGDVGVTDIDQGTGLARRGIHHLSLLDTRSAATASVRYRALQQWFGWLEREDEVSPNPMAKLRSPTVPEKPVPVLTYTQCRALLRTCDGKGFVNRRNTAALRLFVDTGMRLAELAGLTLTDLDLELRPAVAFVVGKGRRQRACAMGAKTELALDS